MSKNNLICVYEKLFVAAHNAGCHQKPERSFFYKNYQFPFCARCTGVLIGYIAALLVYPLVKANIKISFVLCFLMFADWLLQYAEIKESTNARRIITGTMAGYGIMNMELTVFIFLIKKIINFF